MSKLDLKGSKSLFSILALGAIMAIAAISIASTEQTAIAENTSENSTDAKQSEGEYKHGEGKDCPFKDKKDSSTSTPRERK